MKLVILSYILELLRKKIFLICYILIFFILNFQEGHSNSCLKKIIFHFYKPKPSREIFSDEVEILYYPKAGYTIFGHTELKVGNKVFSTLRGIKEKQLFRQSLHFANKDGYGFYRFKLKITSNELKKIKKFISEHENLNKNSMTCVGGVCKILKSNTSTAIPPPFNLLPAWNALYLTLIKKMGYKKIESIKFVGNKELRSLVSPELLFEVGGPLFATYFAGFAIKVQLENGEKKEIVIPVEVK